MTHLQTFGNFLLPPLVQPVRVSRSAIVTREECPRLRLLEYDLDGGGYTLRPSTIPLLQGTAGHDGLAVALQETLTSTAGDLTPTDHGVAAALSGFLTEATERGAKFMDPEDPHTAHIVAEQRWLLEVVLRAWWQVRWPIFAADYDIWMPPEAAWESEIIEGVTEPLRMDVILQNRETRGLTILDFKWTSSDNDSWFTGHAYSRQTYLYIEALVKRLEAWGFSDLDVEGIAYEGLVRGRFAKDTAKSSPWAGLRIQQTLWCYGYQGPGGELQTEYTNKKGYHKVAAWTVATPQEWIDLLQREGKLEKLFSTMPATNPVPEARVRKVRQIGLAEQRWAGDVQAWHALRARVGDTHPVVEDMLDVIAPQHTERCVKFGFDNRCMFAGVCGSVGAWRQLSTGETQFQPRVDHHAPAIEEVAA